MFDSPADAYDAFMGVYSRLLAPAFAAFSGVVGGQRVADVGCGPGALTEVLAALAGADSVVAADPSPQFAAACAARLPGVDVREAPAEALPWADASVDASVAQLVFAFVGDASAALAELTRVTRPDGVVATCMWDLDEMAMLRTFWDAASAVEPTAPTERSALPFGNRADLEALWRSGVLHDVAVEPIDVARQYPDFDAYWRPFLAGVGPAGSYCASLAPELRDAVKDECFLRLGSPGGSFILPARAWAVRGRVPS